MYAAKMYTAKMFTATVGADPCVRPVNRNVTAHVDVTVNVDG